MSDNNVLGSVADNTITVHMVVIHGNLQFSCKV